MATNKQGTYYNFPLSILAKYSDGSQLNSQPGWGAASFYKGKVQESYGNMANAEVFDAEVKGAKEALRLICRTTRRNAGITEAHLFLDNHSVIQGLTGKVPESSQQLFRETRALARAAGVLVKVSSDGCYLCLYGRYACRSTWPRESCSTWQPGVGDRDQLHQW